MDSGFSFSMMFEDEAQPQYCAFSLKFQAWVIPQLERARTENTHIAINETILLITRKYRECRNFVPKAHRNYTSDRGHICIFHVWDDSVRALESYELDLERPQVYLPEPPKRQRKKKELPDEPDTSILGEIIDDF